MQQHGSGPLSLDITTLEPPAKRFVDASHVVATYLRLRREGEPAAVKRAVAQKLIDFEPPLREDVLKQIGREDAYNLNWGEADGMMRAALAPYYNLIYGVPRIVDVQLDIEDPQESYEKSEQVSELWDEALKSWTELPVRLNELCRLFVGDGVAVAIHPDCDTWQFQPAGLEDFFAERDSRPSVNELDMMIIRKKLTVGQLYDQIRDEEAAKVAGWNPEVVKQAIIAAAPDTKTNWEEIQRSLKEHWYHTAKTEYQQVIVLYVLVKEFSGKVTRLIASPLIESKEFLYERDGYYDSMGQAGVLFTNGVGSGTLHTIIGLKQIIYNVVQCSNRARNEMMESAMAYNRMIFKAAPEDIEEFQHMRLGPYDLMNESIEPMAISPRDPSALLPMIADMSRLLQNNTGTFQARAVTPEGGGERTATEVEAQVRQESMLSEAQQNVFFASYDQLHESMFRRAIASTLTPHDQGYQIAKEFLSKCKRYGITREDLNKVKRVKARRGAGFGSANARTYAIREAITYSASLGESGKTELLMMGLTNALGYDNARRLVGERGNRLTLDSDIARLENASMRQGVAVEPHGDQNHVSHLLEHYPPLNEVIEGLRAGQIPEEQALTYLRPAIDHITKHTVMLSENKLRVTEAKQMRKELQNVAAFVNQLDQRLTAKKEKERRQQLGAQPVTPEQQAKLQELSLQIQSKEMDNRNKQAEHDRQMEVINAKIALADAERAMKFQNNG